MRRYPARRSGLVSAPRCAGPARLRFRGVVALCLLGSALVGCGSPDEVARISSGETLPTGEVPGPALSGAAEPPFADVSGMAPLGEGVAVLNAAPEPFQRGETALRLADVALRLQDGTWAELPDAPPLWNPSVAAVGETIALLGLECDSDRCLNLVPKGFLLSSDLQSWNPGSSR